MPTPPDILVHNCINFIEDDVKFAQEGWAHRRGPHRPERTETAGRG
ncbi:hypothetical protein KCH_78040 [Kitasatospora cheerisanensis KCTC 2395]|uniref:Uncharacterized protein n=1 Tax=Kitasatospora cheerisanensis KCTC 2395 TaxID=1348663 RepID=A0A066YH10_9ACTN|nr:hypothetical protein KCH_78040 [Kitasatospora cheerisanensis KCTC 2395]